MSLEKPQLNSFVTGKGLQPGQFVQVGVYRYLKCSRCLSQTYEFFISAGRKLLPVILLISAIIPNAMWIKTWRAD